MFSVKIPKRSSFCVALSLTFAARFTDKVALDGGVARCAAEPYLDAQGERFANRFAGTAFLRLSESIDLHDIDPADVPVPVTRSLAGTGKRLGMTS